jgi:hypothetical protein
MPLTPINTLNPDNNWGTLVRASDDPLAYQKIVPIVFGRGWPTAQVVWTAAGGTNYLNTTYGMVDPSGAATTAWLAYQGFGWNVEHKNFDAWSQYHPCGVGQIYTSDNNLYLCIVAGQTGSIPPSATSNPVPLDGSVTWHYLGAGNSKIWIDGKSNITLCPLVYAFAEGQITGVFGALRKNVFYAVDGWFQVTAPPFLQQLAEGVAKNEDVYGWLMNESASGRIDPPLACISGFCYRLTDYTIVYPLSTVGPITDGVTPAITALASSSAAAIAVNQAGFALGSQNQPWQFGWNNQNGLFAYIPPGSVAPISQLEMRGTALYRSMGVTVDTGDTVFTPLKFGTDGLCQVGTIPSNPMLATPAEYNCNPADILHTLWSSVRFGMGWTTSTQPQLETDLGVDLLAASSCRRYCIAMNFLVSRTIETQESCLQAFQTLLEEINCRPVWTVVNGVGTLRIVPLGMNVVTANGVTYTPADQSTGETSDYLLGPTDFIPKSKKADGLEIKYAPYQEIKNVFPVSYYDNSYFTAPDQTTATDLTYSDAGGQQQHETTYNAKWICQGPHAMALSYIKADRAQKIQRKFMFTLSPRYVRIEAGDVLSIFHPRFNIPQTTPLAVLVLSAEEDDRGRIDIVAEDWLGTVVPATPIQTRDGLTGTGIGSIAGPPIIPPTIVATDNLILSTDKRAVASELQSYFSAFGENLAIAYLALANAPSGTQTAILKKITDYTTAMIDLAQYCLAPVPTRGTPASAIVPTTIFEQDTSPTSMMLGGIVPIKAGDTITTTVNAGANTATFTATADGVEVAWTTCIWGSSTSNIWLGAWGGMLHWDGTTWTPWSLPTADPIGCIWGSSATDVWAISNANPDILHWDGTSWTLFANPAGLGVNDAFVDIWGSGPNDVWAITYTGYIVHWNGTSWTVSYNGASTAYWFEAVGGSSSTDVWVSGPGLSASCPMLHWNGTTWTSITPPLTTFCAYAIYSAGPNNVWFAGSADATGHVGAIFHWNGTSWTSATLPTSVAFITSMIGFSATDIWALAANHGNVAPGILFHWNGTAWTQVATLDSWGMLLGFSDSDIWCGGQRSIQHYNGTTWSSTPTPPVGSAINNETYVAGTWDNYTLFQTSADWSSFVWTPQVPPVENGLGFLATSLRVQTTPYFGYIPPLIADYATWYGISDQGATDGTITIDGATYRNIMQEMAVTQSDIEALIAGLDFVPVAGTIPSSPPGYAVDVGPDATRIATLPQGSYGAGATEYFWVDTDSTPAWNVFITNYAQSGSISIPWSQITAIIIGPASVPVTQSTWDSLWGSSVLPAAKAANDFSNVPPGSIKAPLLAAGAVTTAALTVTDFVNQWPNGNSETPIPTGVTPSSVGLTAAGVNNDPQFGNIGSAYAHTGTYGRALNTAAAVSGTFQLNGPLLPCQPGDQFWVEAYVYKLGGGTTNLWGRWNGVGTTIMGGAVADSGVPASVTTTGVWTRIGATFTAPPGATGFQPFFDGSPSAGNGIWFDDIYVMRRGDGRVLVDGSITGRMIAGNAIQSSDYVSYPDYEVPVSLGTCDGQSGGTGGCILVAGANWATQIQIGDRVTQAPSGSGTVLGVGVTGAFTLIYLSPTDVATFATIVTNSNPILWSQLTEAAFVGAKIRANQPGSTQPAIYSSPQGIKIGHTRMSEASIGAFQLAAFAGALTNLGNYVWGNPWIDGGHTPNLSNFSWDSYNLWITMDVANQNGQPWPSSGLLLSGQLVNPAALWGVQDSLFALRTQINSGLGTPVLHIAVQICHADTVSSGGAIMWTQGDPWYNVGPCILTIMSSGILW